MTLVLQRESTEYIYLGLTGTPPAVGAEITLLPAGTRPTSGDWRPAEIVPDNTHPLWADATSSGASGTYYLAILVGTYGGGTFAPAAGDYQMWVRLTDATEQPVRIAPEAVEVQ